MKAIFQITAAATAVAAALALQLPAVAQTAGTVNVGGQVTSATCVLAMGSYHLGDAPEVLGGSRTVSLVYNTAPPVGAVAGTIFGSIRGVTLALKDSNGQACPLPDGTVWNVLLNLSGSEINTTINGLVNKLSLANGGTSAAVAVFGSPVSLPGGWVRLNLSPSDGLLGGTKVLSQSIPANSGIGVAFHFVTTSASTPNAGQYSASLPLTILYN